MAAARTTTNDRGTPERPPVIEGYGGGGFRVAGVVHSGSLIVLPSGAVTWEVAEFAQIDAVSLPPALFGDAGIELLLLGCGARMKMVPAPLRAALREAGAVVEAMDTGAAVRTYNVLLGEHRRVAAALIAVD